MIKITGETHRSFIFPAELPTAFEYYSDLNRTFSILPHISILQQYDEGQFRMLFSTTELGIYRVRLICDLQAEIDQDHWIVRFLPLAEAPHVKNKAGISSLSGKGYYSSISLFRPQENHTQIDYKLRLHANLPVPFGLRFMPTNIINDIAARITQWRINEIAETFIEHSLYAFQSLEQIKG